jgi:hypothetical protein
LLRAQRATYAQLPSEEQETITAHLQALLEAATYVFASTMPENPHWYTHRRTWADDAAFEWCVLAIRIVGDKEKFQGNHYICFNHPRIGKVWSMGWHPAATILINRKPLLVETPVP